MSKSQYRRRLSILLMISLLFISAYYIYQLRESIPDRITIESGSDGLLKMRQEPSAFWGAESVETGAGLPKNAVRITIENDHSAIGDASASYTAQYKLLGIIDLKSVPVNVVEEQEVYPGGMPVGIYVETDGILVIGSGTVTGVDGVEYEPAANILRSGDYILAVNEEKVTTKEAFVETVNRCGNETVVLEIRRNKKISKVKLTPVQTGKEEYRLGIWIRDNTQGIGMLTFVTKDRQYGALGHGITDVDTGLLMNIAQGRLLDTDIISIVKGASGKPGELVGMIDYRSKFLVGTVEQNTSCGIFGTVSEDAVQQLYEKYHNDMKTVPVAFKQDMKAGPAVIRTCLDGEIGEYQIEIEKINRSSENLNKSVLIKVTDEALIEKTGGIVQGLSGSPILQDGKLVGAVTHVLVNDPTRGYGIFIENMLVH